MTGLERKLLTHVTSSAEIPAGYFRDNQSIERVQFVGIQFDGEKFYHSLLKTCEFVDCTFAGCIFDRMDLQRVWFRQCRFTNCSFSPEFRYITGELVESPMIDCDLPNSFIQHVKWIRSPVTSCDLRFLKAKSITFCETPLSDVRFDGATITRGDFKSVPGLRRAMFYNVRLDDCEFSWNEVFVVMQFNDSHLENLYKYGICEVLEELGVDCRRLDEYEFKGRITDQMLQNIVTSKVIVAECSAANKNVYFEVGYALGNGKDVVLLVDRVENIPFDLKDLPFIIHDNSIEILKEKLEKRMRFLLGIIDGTKDVAAPKN